jgi:hypothetical protein
MTVSFVVNARVGGTGGWSPTHAYPQITSVAAAEQASNYLDFI